MSTQNSINEESVLNYDKAAIAKNLDYVLSKVQESIVSENEQEILEHVSFFLENVLQHITVNEVENVILKDVSCVTSEMFQSTINGIESVNDLAVLSQTQMNRSEACFHLLDLCCHILVSLLQSCQYFLGHAVLQFTGLENYLKCLDCVSKKGTQHYQKRGQIYKEQNMGIDEFWKKLTELQSQYYVLVATKIQFDYTSREQVTALREIFLSITATAVESFEFDVVFMATSWKSFLTFVEKYHEHGIKNDEIGKVMSILSEKIGNDLDALLDGQRSIKDMANTLKVDNFLLKIVVKLCRIFRGNVVGNALAHLVDLLLTLFRSTPTFLRASGKSQEEITEITKQLSVGADPLLSSLYTELSFLETAKKKIGENCEKNPYGCLTLLMSLWKKLTAVKLKDMFFSEELHILDLIFNSFEACHFQIVSGKVFSAGSVTQQNYPDLYEFVLTTLASVILTFSGDEYQKVEDHLLRNVLQPYPWRAILACDLWVLLARCGDLSLCNATIEALIPVFQLIDDNTPRPEFIYLSWLLRRLFPLTDSQFMMKISEKYPPRENTKIWGIIGLQHFKPENQIPGAVESCVSVISNWTRNDSPSVDLHNRMQDSLMAISSIPTQLDEIKTIWDCLPEYPNQRVLDTFLHSTAAVTSSAVAVMPENILIDILQIICEILSNDLSASQKFSILRVLSSLSSVSVSSKNLNRLLEYVVTGFKTVLKSKSVIIRNIAYRSFMDLSFSPTFMEYIGRTVSGDHKLKQQFSNFLMKILPSQLPKPPMKKIIYSHRCYEGVTSSNTELCPKRIKLDDSNVKTSLVQEALTRLGTDICVVIDNYTVLNQEQKNSIRTLHSNLTNFLNTI